MAYGNSWKELMADRVKSSREGSGAMAPRPTPVMGPKHAGKWAGRFIPKKVSKGYRNGMLEDDDWTGNTGPQPPQEDIQPILPRESMTLPSIGVVPTMGYPTPAISSTVGGSQGGSFFDSLFSGLAKVVTPAAQALVGIKANETVQQARQRALAQTWNPTLTGPALQAQAYQNAFMTGSGASPISTTTLVVGGLVALGIIFAMSGRR